MDEDNQKEESEIKKLKKVEDKYKKQFEDEKFQKQIDEQITEADKLIREYELKIKKGNFDINPPYQNVIEIYTNIREQLLEKGWNEQANVYSNQIKILNQKQAQDNKLRNIEAQKREKEREYQDSFKIKKQEEIDIEKLKAVEKKYKKEFEDEKLQEDIDKKVTDAENLLRNYELEIKKGNFESEPPFQEVIEIYEDIRNRLLERNWIEQANIYLNQIKLIKEKQANDQKLRELEAQKIEKDKEYQEAIKVRKEKKIDEGKMKAVEDKLLRDMEDEKFQDEITERVTEAENLIREYEIQIKKGNFDNEPPYQNVLEIYEDIRKQFLERNWIEQANIYLNQIKLVKDKQVSDQKLRELEAQKIEKDKEYQEAIKVRKEKKIDESKMKAVEDKLMRDLEDEKFQDQITERVTKAENLIREYEIQIKKGNFESQPPYLNVLGIYREIRKELLEHNWNEQANIYLNQIKLVQEKITQDEKLRKIEVQKREKEKEYQDSLKLREKRKIDEGKMKAVEDKLMRDMEDEQFQDQITERVTRAENQIREYEIQIKKGNFESEPPYLKVIEVYEDIKKQLLERNWNEQANIYSNQIKLLREKQTHDERLREIETQKKQKDAEYLESMKLSERKKSKHKKLKAADEKLRKELEDEIFQNQIESQISEAEKLIRNYELEIKKGNFNLEPPYKDVIKVYRDIRQKLIERNWNDQAIIYQNQIKILNDKLEKDQFLREIEAHKTEKEKAHLEAMKLGERKRSEYKKILFAQERIKKEAEDETFQNQIDGKVTKAEKMIRDYEAEIKKGNFESEPPYQNVIEIYEDIRKQLLERDWKEEAMIYGNQIKLIKEKLEKDIILREIEGQKLKKQLEYEELIKASTENGQLKTNLDHLKEVEERHRKDFEEDVFQKKITELVNKAEEIARRYEFAIRQGNFEETCPYQEIIDIYTEVKNKLIERGWSEQANNYTKQINLYLGKLEKDKKLREIEAQKAQKQKEFEETFKSKQELKMLKKDEEKLKTAEIQYQKELEDEKFQTMITNMVNKAEEMVRKYEFAIRQGKFEVICPYQEVIEIYSDAKNKLVERGWSEQALIYAKQINLYLGKLEKDKKLREIEAQKAQKQKVYEDSIKIKEDDKQIKADLEKLKLAEEIYQKELEDANFENEIAKMVDQAEEMARKYEFAIRLGKFEENCPYQEIIDLYTEAKNKLIERGWSEQANIYTKQVNYYIGKLENDKRLREIEAQKAQKQKEFEELRKIQKEDKQLEEDLEKLKAVEEQYQREIEEENFENEIAKMVDEADSMARKYELSLRRGKFEESCPYSVIIELYEQVKKKLLEKGWSDEAAIYRRQIQLYQDKYEQDKKLREIERLKLQKQKDFEEQFLIKAEQELEGEAKRIKAVEEKYETLAEEENFQREISSKVDRAEETARKYEFAIRQGKFEEKCPYPEIINIYKDVYQNLKEKGWIDQAFVFNSQIQLYEEKLEKDNKLREFEAQKETKSRELMEYLKTQDSKAIDESKIKILEAKKREKEKFFDDGFSLIDRAEKLVKEYELRLKVEKNILQFESPYEEAIKLYRQARQIFQDNQWDNEANGLINTINYYKDKQEKDEKLRAFEKSKAEREIVRPLAVKSKAERAQREREKKALALEEQKRQQEELSNEAFQIIDNAESMAKRYELDLKDGIFPEPPFEEIIKMYRNARTIFEEIGWEDQAIDLINTINYYKEKMEADKKLRALETKKIEKQKRELEEQQRILKKQREKEMKQLKLKEEALFAKREQEKELESKKFKAFSLMDQARRQLDQDYFDSAIELYEQSQNIISEINWAEGLKMVQESIAVIKRKKKEFELREKAIEEEEAEKRRLEMELEEEITKTKELERLQQELQREEMLKIQKQKEKESQASERAYALLEDGTQLLEKKKFREAYDAYIEAQEIFKELDWIHEVNRINNELLLTLQMEETKQKRLEEYKQKKMQEKQDLENMLLEAEQQRKELETAKIKEKREKLKKLRVSDKLKDRIEENLERANIEIQNGKYNKGVLKLKDIIKMMERVGWDKEIVDVNNQIHVLKNKSHVPLIVLEEPDENENIEKFKSAYIALDKAHVSLLKNRIMKAISELNESVFNLKETKIGIQYIEQIETKIEELREGIEKKRQLKDVSDIEGIEIEEGKPLELSSELAYEYMDKCKKEERRNNFKKAIDLATTAKEIFVKLGPEWSREIMSITRYISTLENKQVAREESFKRKKEELEEKEKTLKEEEEEFKERIAARKEARKRRIRELMEKK